MPFFPGLVAGFTGALDEGRARNVEEQGRINARENQILSLLASSDDDEVKALAISTMLDLAGPKPKGKGLAGFLREAQGSPQFAAVQRFVNSTRTETQQVPDVESQPAASLTSNFERSAQAGSAAQPEAQPLAEAPPGDIQQILAAGGVPDTQLDIGGGLEGALGTPPPVPTTGQDVQVPRTLFKSEAEKAGDQQTAEMQAFREQLEELGVLSEREIAEAVATSFGGRPFAAFLGSQGIGRRFQQGNFAIDPERPGEGPFPITFDSVTGERLVSDPSDPSGATKMLMPSNWLQVTSGLMTSVGNNQQALELLQSGGGLTFAGATPEQAREARQGEAEFATGVAVDRASQVTRATGDQQIITGDRMALMPTALAMFPLAEAGESLEDLAGRIPLTTPQRQRVFAANQVDVLIETIETQLPLVFPAVEPGFVGRLQTQFSLAQQMLGADEDLATLDAAIEAALGQVAQLGGDDGRLSDFDIERTRRQLARLTPSVFGGDTLATAQARLNTITVLLQSVRAQTPTQGAVTPAPIETTGDLGTPPPTDPNVVDASSLRPAPQ